MRQKAELAGFILFVAGIVVMAVAMAWEIVTHAGAWFILMVEEGNHAVVFLACGAALAVVGPVLILVAYSDEDD